MAGKGRPSKYKKEYCEQLVKHMSDGFGFKSFAAEISVNPDTVAEWALKHPEFSDAKKAGLAGLERFWETMGRSAAAGRIPNFNATAFVWMTKNQLGWREKKDIALTGADGGPIQYSNLTEQEIDQRLKALTQELNEDDDEF